ncbi:MAG: SRPBCC family protein [Bacteroidia bacterium]
MTPFTTHVKFHFNTTAEKLWDALTNPEVVKQYFFGSNLITTWKVGDPIIFTGEWEGKMYEDKGTILAYEHNRLLKYDYYSSFSPLPDLPENYMIITYSVTVVANGVELEIIQENAASQETADHSNENWTALMNEVKKIVEA